MRLLRVAALGAAALASCQGEVTPSWLDPEELARGDAAAGGSATGGAGGSSATGGVGASSGAAGAAAASGAGASAGVDAGPSDAGPCDSPGTCGGELVVASLPVRVAALAARADGAISWLRAEATSFRVDWLPVGGAAQTIASGPGRPPERAGMALDAAGLAWSTTSSLWSAPATAGSVATTWFSAQEVRAIGVTPSHAYGVAISGAGTTLVRADRSTYATREQLCLDATMWSAAAVGATGAVWVSERDRIGVVSSSATWSTGACAPLEATWVIDRRAEALAASATRVAWASSGSGGPRLWSAPIDGSAAPTDLGEPIAPTATTRDPALFVVEGDRVIFVEDAGVASAPGRRRIVAVGPTGDRSVLAWFDGEASALALGPAHVYWATGPIFRAPL